MAWHPEPDEDARNESISQAENASMRGVLLAADAAGHKLVPSLPAAPQAEIDAVSNQA